MSPRKREDGIEMKEYKRRNGKKATTTFKFFSTYMHILVFFFFFKPKCVSVLTPIVLCMSYYIFHISNNSNNNNINRFKIKMNNREKKNETKIPNSWAIVCVCVILFFDNNIFTDTFLYKTRLIIPSNTFLSISIKYHYRSIMESM